MGKWNITSQRGTVSILQSLTHYCPIAGDALDLITTEAQADYTMRVSYTLADLFVFVNTNLINVNPCTIRSRKNGSNGSQSVSIAASATGEFEDTTNSDSYIEGDEANSQIVVGSASMGRSLVFTTIGYTLDDSSGDEYPLIICQGDQTGDEWSEETTQYFPIAGDLSDRTTESEVEYTIRQTATFDNLRAFCTVNQIDAASTFTLRKNRADGNTSVSITANSTGSFEDTANSDSFVDGNEADYELTIPNSGNMNDDLTLTTIGVSVAGEGYIAMSDWNDLGVGLNGGTVRYDTIEGRVGPLATEDDQDVTARVATEAENFYLLIVANAANGETIVALRVANANSDLSVSVGATTTGIFEDTADVVSISDGDDLAIIYDSSAGSSGFFRPQISAFEQRTPPVDDMAWYDMSGVGVIRNIVVRSY